MFKRDEIVNLTKLLVIAIACSAGLQACASITALPPAPPLKPVATAAPLLLGVNDGGHTGVPPEIVDRYCGWNRELVIRSAVLSVAEMNLVIDSLRPCTRLHSLVLVEKNDLALVQALANWIGTSCDRLPECDSHLPWGIELGNELDLAGLTPWQFNDFIAQASALLRHAGYRGTIITGGIYTVDNHSPQDFETYLRPALDSCPDCVVGLHWYGDTSEYWLARVQALGLPVAVTEFGIAACTPAQETAQLAYVRDRLTAYARPGNVQLAIVYQRLSASAPCDGTDASHLAHFGFQRPGPDDSWNGVADLLATWPR